MPEDLEPGVFVEEVSYRAKSIEGVDTTTTGFIDRKRTAPRDAGARPWLVAAGSASIIAAWWWLRRHHHGTRR
jgi:phage tail sheath protein FI